MGTTEIASDGIGTQTATTSVQNSFTQTCIVTSKQRGIQVQPKIASAGIQTDFVEHRCFSASCMEDNDSMTKFYTGLSSWKVFEHVFSILLPHIPRKRSLRSKLTPKDEFFLVLMRLRLDLRVEDIAYRFSIAKSTVVTIFNAWINVMAIRLKFF